MCTIKLKGYRFGCASTTRAKTGATIVDNMGEDGATYAMGKEVGLIILFSSALPDSLQAREQPGSGK